MLLEEQMMKVRAKKSGLTLVEVLMALVLVSLAASMFLYFADALRITRVSQQETVAANYLSDYLSRLRSVWSTNSNYNKGLEALGTELAVPENLKLTVLIKDVEGVPIPDSSEEQNPSQDVSELRHIFLEMHDSRTDELVVSMSTSIAAPPD